MLVYIHEIPITQVFRTKSRLSSPLLVRLTVVAPIKKAMISVSDVTVIEAPECLRAFPILSFRGNFCCSSDRFFNAPTITNMSSTPIPNNEKR